MRERLDEAERARSAAAISRIRRDAASRMLAERRAYRDQHQPELRGRRRAFNAGGRRDVGEHAAAFKYGQRVGNWRILRILKQFGVKVSVLGGVRALEQSPDAVAAFPAGGHEIVSHCYRWIDYQTVDEATERAHIRLAFESMTRLTGSAPVG